jgi:hypothetical protein
MARRNKIKTKLRKSLSNANNFCFDNKGGNQ